MEKKLKVQLTLDLASIQNQEDNDVTKDQVYRFRNNDEDEVLLEEYLSVEKLQQATGEQDLTVVHYLEIIVDTRENSLGNIGEKLLNLKQLKLNNSTIPSIRDLGTTLKHLQILWLSRCSISELEGIAALPNLLELYLAFNDIDDISALSALEKIQILDLEGNHIEDISQVHFLADCKELYSLTLDGNPISKDPLYRTDVLNALPQLKLLDDQSIEQKIKLTSSTDSLLDEMDKKLEAERQFINYSIKYSRIDSVENTSLIKAPVVVAMSPRMSPSDMISMAKRPSSSLGFIRPSTAQQNGSQTSRPRTPMQLTPRPMTARDRPSSSLGFKKTNNAVEEEDTSSSLTFGSKDIICGNPTRSLRSRKMERTSTPKPSNTLTDEQLLLQVMTNKLENPIAEVIDSFDELEKEEANMENLLSNYSDHLTLNNIPVIEDVFPQKKKKLKNVEKANSISPISPITPIHPDNIMVGRLRPKRISTPNK